VGLRSTQTVGALIAAAMGCDGGLPASDGSRLSELRSWVMEVSAEGEIRKEWIVPEGELPGDALSLTLVAHGDDTARIAFEVHDVFARLLVDPRRSEWSPNRALTSRGVAVAMLPSASSTLPLTRNFQVAVHLRDASPQTPQPRVSVFLKRPASDGAPVPAVQELPLAVVLVGDAEVGANKLGRALEELVRIWKGAGLAIRPHETVHLKEPQYARHERLVLDEHLGSDSPELGRLLALSELFGAELERPLVMFLLADIVTGPGASVWAVSGGIPVPPVLGTARSGIAVNRTLVEVDPVRAGQVMAHEIGHALGLYHTTEGTFVRRGDSGEPEAVHDQLDDTPACPPDADRSPADGTLSPDECETHDGRNLMFWAATRSSTRLTPAQGDIARRSALSR
jgi:hypothetical protein